MFKFAKKTKSCFINDNLKNKKLYSPVKNTNVREIQKNDVSLISKVNIQSLRSKESSNNLNSKDIYKNNSYRKRNIQDSSEINKKKKINDYFNKITRDITNEIPVEEKNDLEIPDFVKSDLDGVLLPPCNYFDELKEINTLKDQESKDKEKTKDERETDEKVVLRKERVMSTNELHNYMIIIYDNIIMDNYENELDEIENNKNNLLKIKKTNKHNNNLYNLFIDEINVCYNNDNNELTNIRINDNKINGRINNKEYQTETSNNENETKELCKLKKKSHKNKLINQVLEEVYSLSLQDESINTTEIKNDHNNNNSKIEYKPLTQQVLISPVKFSSSVIRKSKKRKHTMKKSSGIQTKLSFNTNILENKRQKM